MWFIPGASRGARHVAYRILVNGWRDERRQV
jgi:hypothetical protein